jgi:membrane dipeptidase
MVLDHIDHALKVCGEEHVGIGTDGPVPTVRESREFFDMMKKVEKQRAAAGVQAPGEQGRFPYIQELNHPRRIEQRPCTRPYTPARTWLDHVRAQDGAVV